MGGSEYRDDLANAHARIHELETKLDERAGPPKRPVTNWVVCFLLVLGGTGALLMTKAQARDYAGWGYPSWYIWVTDAVTAVQIVAGVGLWRLRRWGLFLLAASILIAQLFLLAIGRHTPGSLFVSALLLGLALVHWKRLR